MATDVRCTECDFLWMGADKHELVKKTNAAVRYMRFHSCPECGKDALEVMAPWCPVCNRTGRDACICDDEEAKKKARKEQMQWNEVPDDVEEAFWDKVKKEAKERIEQADQEEITRGRRNRHRRIALSGKVLERYASEHDDVRETSEEDE